MNAPSPLSGASDVVSFAVSINGRPLPDEAGVISIAIDHRFGGAPNAHLTFQAEDPVVLVRDRVEIRAGYGGDLRPIFFGEVLQVGFKASGGSGAQWSFSGAGMVRAAAANSASVLTLTYGEDVIAAELANATADTPPATTGTIRFQGSALVFPGDNVSLAGFPTVLFCGVVPVCGVTQHIADGNWSTTVELGAARDPAPAEIVLADANGNRLRLDAQGISLRSPAAIAVNGQSVALSAESALTARGGATAEISAAGDTIVRGAMVRIN